MPVKGKFRFLLPVAALPLLALVPSGAKAVPPGPFYRGTSAGMYAFRLPLEIPMGPRRTVDTELQVSELMFSVPVARLGEKGPKLNAGGVAGTAGLRNLGGKTGFAKLGLTLQGIGLGRGVQAEIGVRGKGYRDSQGKRTAGLDVGARASWRNAELEGVLYDWLRRGEERIWKAKAGLKLPAGFKIEGSVNTESEDPSLAASRAFVLMGAKGGRGPPRVMVVPEAGLGLRTKTPYGALAVKAGRLMAVGIQEPYKGEKKTTMGTHVVVSVDLARLFSGEGKRPTHSELREKARESGERGRASIRSRELARLRRR
ncbi:MAG: hypothetical protein V1787_01530 [Candidatus Micrarchaeota archaeon]